MSMIVDDLRIVAQKPLSSPAVLKRVLPLSEQGADFVAKARADIANIIHGRDKRLLVVTGPCSIHDPVAAIDYANKLKALQLAYQDSLYIVMRVYFEKPRTTVGWKGFINDPHAHSGAETFKFAGCIKTGIAVIGARRGLCCQGPR